MDYLKIHSYNGIHLGQHISEFYSTLVPENIFFQGMRISYVFQKATEPLTTEVARFLSTI